MYENLILTGVILVAVGAATYVLGNEIQSVKKKQDALMKVLIEIKHR